MTTRTNQEAAIRMIPPAGLHEPMSVHLKTAYDGMTGPMPHRMQELADALDAAFQRGELGPAKQRLRLTR